MLLNFSKHLAGLADLFVNDELKKYINKTSIKNIISEENIASDYISRKKWNYFWMIDPIDGTKEFLNKSNDYTRLCRETSNLITDKSDREKTIKLLSEMIASDKIVHQKELFAYQIIAEEWNMYRGE